LKLNHLIELKEKRILILGAGGATRGIILPLLDEKPDSLVVANRTVEKVWQLAVEFNHSFLGCGFDDLHELPFDLILNATSASLSGELPPISDNLLAENGVCYDLAYSNKPTAFVEWGRAQNAKKSLDGLGMLVEQAAEAFFLWRNVRPRTQPVIEFLYQKR
jgi:shikimate dehydrogenase